MNKLDRAINDDFVKIIEQSSVLKAVWHTLPPSQQYEVLTAWNRLIWEMITAAAKGKNDTRT